MTAAVMEAPIEIAKLPMVPVVPTYRKPILRFELLFGRHEERNPRWKPTHQRKDAATGVLIPVMLNEDGDEVPENILYTGPNKRVGKIRGDIIETTVDLIRAIDHNSGSEGVKKFRRLDDPVEVAQLTNTRETTATAPPETVKTVQHTPETLGGKSIRDLQIMCASGGIPYDTGARKEQLIQLIIGANK